MSPAMIVALLGHSWALSEAYMLTTLIDKLRPNALAVALATAVMTTVFGIKLYNVIYSVVETGNVTEATVALVLALAGLTFTPLGALIALAAQMATDSPPPQVPASVVETYLTRK